MIYKTTPEFSKRLLAMPETGIGYQIVAANRMNSLVRSGFLIFNTELIVDMDYRLNEFRNEIANEGLKKVGNRLAEIVLQDVVLLPKSSFVKPEKLKSKAAILDLARRISDGDASKHQAEKASGTEVFIRPTAFEDDVRVDFMKNRILPGSFTTTREDFLICKEKKDNPLDRYALATSEPIKWLYLIQPAATEVLHRGVVQPLFAQSGGGVEVFFENGTANRTSLKKEEGY